MFCAFHEPAALYRPLSFFHKKYGQNLSIILFAFFFYLFYIPKTQYYIFIAVSYFTLYHFLSSGALFHLCLQHKKRRRMDFRIRSAALLVLENETGGVTFPHLLTMGDGCLFRPPILLSRLLYQNLKICQIPVLNQYFFNVPFSIKFLARFVFKR